MKFSFLLLLACIQVSAQSDYIIFDSGNFQGLKNGIGEEVLPATFDKIGWTAESSQVSGEIIGYQEGEKWGLLNVSGKKITDPIYDKIEPLFPGKIKVGIRGKFTNRYFYGIVDGRGKLLKSMDYFDIQAVGDVILLTSYEDQKFSVVPVTSSLKTIGDFEYQEIRVFDKVIIAKKNNGFLDVFHVNSQPLATDLEEVELGTEFLITRRGGKDGLISLEGKEIYPPIHKRIISTSEFVPFPTWEVKVGASSFEIPCDSLQYLSQDVWLCYYNDQMQIHLSKAQPEVESFDLAQLTKEMVVVKSITSGNWHAYNKSGERVLTAVDSLIFDGQFLLAKNGKAWSVYTRSGKQTTDRNFDQVMQLSNQFVGVKKFGYWALLNGLSREVSDFRYDSIASVIEYKAIAKYLGKWGVYNTNSGWIVPPEYDHISFELNHFIAVKGYSYYLYDAYGELVFKTIDQIVPMEDYFMLKYEHLHSAIGASGQPVANTSYLSVTKMGPYFALNEGTATAVVSAGGKFVIRLTDGIKDVGGYSEGLFLIRKDGGFGFVDVNAKLRIANRYDSAMIFSEGLAPVKIRGGWGFINASENLIIQPYYQSVTPFENGVSIFKLKGKYGLVDIRGKEFVNADYKQIIKTFNGLYLVQNMKGLWGLIDGKGVARLSPAFNQLKDLGDNKLMALQNGKYGLLDYAGKILVPFSYERIIYSPEYLLLKQLPLN